MRIDDNTKISLIIFSITGLQWVQGEASASGRPSVVNMSLGGSKSPSMDSAVNSLTTSGVHVAVAAGNSGLPAEAFSPASAPSAFTVAATNITDTRPWWSNWGLSVDIFAPGQDILSAWNTNDTVRRFHCVLHHLLITPPGYKPNFWNFYGYPTHNWPHCSFHFYLW